MVTRGTQFSKKLRSLPPEQQKPCRIVPAFTLQSLQKGTCITPPPKLDIYAENKPKEENLFRIQYKLGILPIIRNPNGKMYTWKEDLDKINYAKFLPIFFEGLMDLEEPFNSIAKNCIDDLLNFSGPKVLAAIPVLIVPLRKALKTKNKKIMISTLKVLQHLIKSHPCAGEALLPYYNHFLPVLNLFKERNVNCGERIDNSHASGENLADVINDTLGIIEEHGGPRSFAILKRIFPTYESQVWRDRFICMCMNTRWKDAMDVPYLWKHMSVRLDVDFFEVSTIQLTIEYCKYIKSLELRFEYPEEPMQWINYKMMDITKRTYRFLSIFVNKNLQIQKLSFNNFCDFYRSKKILYYLSMFLRSQYNIKIISFNGSYFSKKALIKILTSSIAANHSSIEYLDIQNSYYEHDFRLLPGQFNELAEQLSTCITNIDNLLVLKIDFESLLSNNVLHRLVNNKCNTLEYLDIRVAGHDLNNIWRSLHLYSNSIWINLKKKFVDLKVSITFYDVIYKNEIIEQILTRSLPLYCVSWITDTILLKELYTFILTKYSKTLNVVKIHIKSNSLDDLLILALSNCPELKYIEFSGVINNMANVHERFRLSNFSGFKNELSARDLKNHRVISATEKIYKNNTFDNFDNKLYKLHQYDINIDVI